MKNADTSRSQVIRLKSSMGDVILQGYQVDPDGEMIDGTEHITMFVPEETIKEKNDET